MKFEEASNMEEGTMFNVRLPHGGAWLNCYFKDGTVNTKIGGKLAASISVFNADWEIVDDDADWNLAEQPIDSAKDTQAFDIDNIKKCRDLILSDIETDVRDKNNYSQEYECGHYFNMIRDIINKRFGDLK